jgi:hypothetical protein
MTWGALNNQREKAASEPLPDFLTGQGNKGSGDKLDPQFQSADDVIVQKIERPHGVRKESGRGYGVAYPGSINIQMSKKTLFTSLVFFATIIVLTFCIGCLAGNVSVAVSASQAVSMPPLKKPIIPARKKGKQEKVKLEKIIEAPVEVKAPAVVPESEEEDFASSDLEEDTATVAPKNKNNKDNDSETLLETTSPEAETDDLED